MELRFVLLIEWRPKEPTPDGPSRQPAEFVRSHPVIFVLHDGEKNPNNKAVEEFLKDKDDKTQNKFRRDYMAGLITVELVKSLTNIGVHELPAAKN